MPGEEILLDHGISPADVRRIAALPSTAMDSAGRLVFVSRSFEQLLGYSAEALIGMKPPFPYWPPEERERFTKVTHLIIAGLLTDLRLFGAPVLFQCQDGRRLQVTTEYECWRGTGPGEALHVRVITGSPDEAGLPRTPDRGELLERIRLDMADLVSCVDALQKSHEAPPIAGHDLLTPREREVLGLLLRGSERGEIARSLSISENTVRNHVGSIYRKLGAHSRQDLVRRLGSPSLAAPARQPTRRREQELG